MNFTLCPLSIVTAGCVGENGRGDPLAHSL
jgi:hypothetical protein